MIDLLKDHCRFARLKGNSKRISGNSLSPLEAQNNDLGAASQTLPAGVYIMFVKQAPGNAAEGIRFIFFFHEGCTFHFITLSPFRLLCLTGWGFSHCIRCLSSRLGFDNGECSTGKCHATSL